MSNQNETTAKEQIQEEPTKLGGLKGIGIGIIIFGLAYYFYTTMTAYESGEEITMNSILLIAYKFLGKNISTGILSAIGLFSVFGGVKEFLGASKK